MLGFGLSPVPIHLGGVGGSLVLDPTLLFPLPPVPVPQPAARGTLRLMMPGNAAGATFYLQGLLVNNITLGAHFCGYTIETVQ